MNLPEHLAELKWHREQDFTWLRLVNDGRRRKAWRKAEASMHQAHRLVIAKATGDALAMQDTAHGFDYGDGRKMVLCGVRNGAPLSRRGFARIIGQAVQDNDTAFITALAKAIQDGKKAGPQPEIDFEHRTTWLERFLVENWCPTTGHSWDSPLPPLAMFSDEAIAQLVDCDPTRFRKMRQRLGLVKIGGRPRFKVVTVKKGTLLIA